MQVKLGVALSVSETDPKLDTNGVPVAQPSACVADPKPKGAPSFLAVTPAVRHGQLDVDAWLGIPVMR